MQPHPPPAVALGPIHCLAIVTVASLGAALLTRLVSVIGSWRLFAQVAARGVGEPGSATASLPLAVLGCSVVVVLVASAMLLYWVWRARTNAELIDPGRQFRFSPGFAVGAWLVPVANLWWSRAVLDELWSASRPPGDRTGSPVFAWWLCTLVGIFLWLLGQAVTPLVLIGSDPAASLRAGAIVDSLGFGVALTGTILLGSVILRVSRWQSPENFGGSPNAFTRSGGSTVNL